MKFITSLLITSVIGSGSICQSNQPCELEKRFCNPERTGIVTSSPKRICLDFCESGTECSMINNKPGCYRYNDYRRCKIGNTGCSIDGRFSYSCPQGLWELNYCNQDQKCKTDVFGKSSCACKEETPIECIDGDRQCDSNKKSSRICVKGKWTVEKTCQNNEFCVHPKNYHPYCVRPCSDGQRICDNKVNGIHTCKQGIYILDGICSSNSKCGLDKDNNPHCYKFEDANNCKEGAKYCHPNHKSKVMVCNKGKMEEQYCLNNRECKMYGFNNPQCEKNRLPPPAPKCLEGQTKCCDKSNGFFECKNGDWIKQDCCEGKKCQTIGQFETTCKPIVPVTIPCCQNGDKKCDNNSNGILICENGQWASQQSCEQDKICRENGINNPQCECTKSNQI